ncbi:hypothetical protein KUTeg_000596 [Tegillarca granosa]|uniref:Uncharacterized protein n=1 Tax=Tegillarca granosa TaxID=220873 RepID=A0ABQ9G2C8_TEGGR|nr:hypothetical protein KUTeg_000596 [Tegillarca granosa]
MATGDEVLDQLAAQVLELDAIIEQKHNQRSADIDDDDDERFRKDTDTEAFVRSMKNRNTERKTQSDIKIFIDFLKSIDEWRSPELIDPAQLANHIAMFFYERQEKFKHSRDVLSAKMKNLKTQGKGNRPNAADPLNKEEVSILYEKGALGLGRYNFKGSILMQA